MMLWSYFVYKRVVARNDVLHTRFMIVYNDVRYQVAISIVKFVGLCIFFKFTRNCSDYLSLFSQRLNFFRLFVTVIMSRALRKSMPT